VASTLGSSAMREARPGWRGWLLTGLFAGFVLFLAVLTVALLVIHFR
jgi:hypothetical protein